MPRLDPKDLASLAILLLVLPDSNQLLSIQTIHEFQLYPKLPPELRAMIWVHTFPAGRNFIYFGDVLSVGTLMPNGADRTRYVTPPIAHRVCQESRNVCMRHYSLVPQILKSKEREELHAGKRSFLFNYSRDSIAVPLFATIESNTQLSNFINFTNLDTFIGTHDKMEHTALSTFLPRLRTLDLLQTFSEERQITPFDTKTTSMLQYCSSLDEIRVCGIVYDDPANSPSESALTAAELKLRADVIQKYSQGRNSEDAAFKIPAITLHHVHAYKSFRKRDAPRRCLKFRPVAGHFAPPKETG